MGYLFLSVALLCGSVKGFCGKKMSSYATTAKGAVLINLARMGMCVLFSLFLVLLVGNLSALTPSGALLAISAVSGISTAAFIVTWLLSVRKSAYMMLDVFLMLGTLVPIVAGRFLFAEPIGARRFIGLAVLVAAALIMCSYNNSIKVKLSPSSLCLLVLCGLSNGVTDLSQKIATKTVAGLSVDVFNFYTYLFATLALLLAAIFMLVFSKEKIEIKKVPFTPIVYILIMACALTANSYFKTQAAFHLFSAQLYPLNQGMSLVLSTVMATVFFGEKLKIKAVLGISLAFIGLMIINL